MPRPRNERPFSSIALSWTLQLTAYLGLWFVLAGAASRAELLAGLACAAVAATVSERVWKEPLARFHGDLRLLGQFWRMPYYAVQGTWEILGVLAKHLAGKPAPSLLRAVPFDAGREDARRDATRRALAVAYTTATPNFVVLGIDQERGLMLYHQLKPSEVLQMTRNLGAAE